MVLLMNSVPVEGVKHVSYADYVSKSDEDLKDSEDKSPEQSGRYFQFVKRSSYTEPINTESRRFLGPYYPKSWATLPRN